MVSSLIRFLSNMCFVFWTRFASVPLTDEQLRGPRMLPVSRGVYQFESASGHLPWMGPGRIQSQFRYAALSGNSGNVRRNYRSLVRLPVTRVRIGVLHRRLDDRSFVLFVAVIENYDFPFFDDVLDVFAYVHIRRLRPRKQKMFARHIDNLVGLDRVHLIRLDV